MAKVRTRREQMSDEVRNWVKTYGVKLTLSQRRSLTELAHACGWLGVVAAMDKLRAVGRAEQSDRLEDACDLLNPCDDVLDFSETTR